MKKFLFVEKLNNPIRIDKYLKTKIRHWSRQQIATFIKSGVIKAEAQNTKQMKSIKPSFLLKGGERIILDLPRKKEKLILKPLSLLLEPEILYEDKNCLLINKPAGISVHPQRKNINEPTIASWLIQRWPFLKKVGEDSLRPGLVHRLDKDTSGVMIIAKNNQAFFYFKNQFSTRKIKKEYLALVWGNLKKDQGIISYPLTRSKKSPFRKKIAQRQSKEKTREALTKYEVLKRFSNFTLLKVFPETGRTHQIRVHLASIGFPVVGDKEYGPRRKKLPFELNQQFLHAEKISFYNHQGNYLEISAPLPKNLLTIMKQLEKT